MLGTTSALLKEAAGQGAMLRRRATCGMAADTWLRAAGLNLIAAELGNRPEAVGCNPSGRPLVSSGEPGTLGSWYGACGAAMGNAAGRECPAGRTPPPWGGAEVCAFDNSVGRPQLVRLWNRFPETTMIGPEFSQVLSAAARGDEEAFGRLWYDLQPRVLRYFAVVSPAAPEGLASETWLRGVRGIERFRGTEPAFRAWVFTIARHELLDRWRRAARRPTEDLAVDGLMEQVAPDDPAAAAVGGFPTGPGRAVVPPPPADQAEAVVLRVVAGLDVNQVAELMDKRPNTVRALTHRGLRRLAEGRGDDARIQRVV